MKKKLFVLISAVFITIVAVVFALGSWSNGLSAETTLFEKSRAETFAQLGPVAKPGKPIRVGVVVLALSNPFWVSMKEGYEHAAKEFGIQMDVQAPPRKTT